MKTLRLIGIGSLALALFGCASNTSGGGFGGGEGTDNSITGDNGSSNGGTNSSGGGSNGSNGSNGSSGSGNSNGSSSSAGSSGLASSNGGSNGGNSSSGSSGSSGIGSSGGSSSGGGTADAGGGIMVGDSGLDNNPDIDYSTAPVTLSMSTFTVAPGGEVFYCQTFANPWGKQVDIKTYQLSMGVGSHHMFAFYASPDTPSALAPCPAGGLTYGAFTFAAQSPTLTDTYPQSVGATIPSGTGFQLMVHYLNTTSSTLTSSVNLTMYIAKPGVVTNHAGAIFLNQATMTVPATCTTGCQSSQSYTLPQDVYILSADSHMHKYATNFVATASSGQTIFTTTEWAEPPAEVYSPPLHLTAGTSITWTCTDVNTTGQELTFGESANTNVMCILTSVFYPVTDISNPVVGTPL
jgi:hypothetical protein